MWGALIVFIIRITIDVLVSTEILISKDVINLNLSLLPISPTEVAPTVNE